MGLRHGGLRVVPDHRVEPHSGHAATARAHQGLVAASADGPQRRRHRAHQPVHNHPGLPRHDHGAGTRPQPAPRPGRTLGHLPRRPALGKPRRADTDHLRLGRMGPRPRRLRRGDLTRALSALPSHHHRRPPALRRPTRHSRRPIRPASGPGRTPLDPPPRPAQRPHRPDAFRVGTPLLSHRRLPSNRVARRRRGRGGAGGPAVRGRAEHSGCPASRSGGGSRGARGRGTG